MGKLVKYNDSGILTRDSIASAQQLAQLADKIRHVSQRDTAKINILKGHVQELKTENDKHETSINFLHRDINGRLQMVERSSERVERQLNKIDEVFQGVHRDLADHKTDILFLNFIKWMFIINMFLTAALSWRVFGNG